MYTVRRIIPVYRTLTFGFTENLAVGSGGFSVTNEIAIQRLKFGSHLKARSALCCGECLESLEIEFNKLRRPRIITSSNRCYLFNLDITWGV